MNTLNLFAIGTAILMAASLCAEEDAPFCATGKVVDHKQKADQGDAESQYLYALELQKSNDHYGAYKYFKKSADNGYGMAFRGVGVGYEFGWAGETNKEESVKWFKRFVDWAMSREGKEIARGQFLLGVSYASGQGVDKSLDLAFLAYKRAADLGCSDAKIEVARCYLNGWGVKKDPVEAAIVIEPLAEDGMAEAQRLLGFMYEYGVGQKMNMDKAISWYEEAAKQGNVEAQCDCGRALINDINRRSDPVGLIKFKQSVAEEWLLKAAAKDSVQAWYYLGMLYEKHFGGERQVEGLRWMEKAARRGHVAAILNLAFPYGRESRLDKDTYRRRAYWGLKYLALDRGLTTPKEVGGVKKWIAWLDENVEGRKLLRDVRKQIAKEGGVAGAGEESKGQRKMMTNISSVLLAGKCRFNGMTFGVNIDEDYQSVKEVDKSIDRGGIGSKRGLVGKSGTHELSYLEAEYVPEKAFRKFRIGIVHASWTSHLVYEVCYAIQFDRDQTVAADFAEYQETLNALKRKYGEGRVDEDSDGDRTAEFRDGHIVILLEYTKEGYLDRGALRLSAWHEKLRDLANKESLAYYQKRMKEETSAVKAGGEDAL